MGRTRPAERVDSFSIWADENENWLYYFGYEWQRLSVDRLSGEIYHPHPQYGTQAQLYINLIEAVIAWKRPQHLAFGPLVYLRDHHPFNTNRLGIRWMGWVPFDLSPNAVTKAELVRPMNGGTLVVTQLAFWQAIEGHPNYSRAAINRAQEVELRLNLLRVLPTAQELERGDWGR